MSTTVGNLARHIHPPRWPWLGATVMAMNCLLDSALLWLCCLLLDRVLVPFAIGPIEPLLVAYAALVTARGLLSFIEVEWWAGSSIAAPALRGLIFFAMLGLLQGQLGLVTLLIVTGVRWAEQRARGERSRNLAAAAPVVATTRAVAGVALVALLGIMMLVLGHLSPGGLLVTLAAATQLALLLAQAEWASRQQPRNVAASLTTPDRSWPTQRLARNPSRHRESFLLVGVPFVVLLAALLGSLARAGDIRPTLPFPGLMLYRPVTPTVPSGSRSSGHLGGAPSPGSTDTPFWQATVGPLPAIAPATPAATSTPTATRTTTSPPTPPAALVSATNAPSPTRAPSPTLVAPQPSNTPPQTPTPIAAHPTVAPPPAATDTPTTPPTARPMATATLTPPSPTAMPPTPTPRPPVASPEPEPKPPPTASPSPRPSASVPPTVATGSIPSSPGDDPNPASPAPTARPIASPTPSPTPETDDHPGDGEDNGPQPTPKPSASPLPTPSPSAKSSPTPRPSPSPTPSPSPQPSNDDDGAASSPSPTPKPSAKGSGGAFPSPSPSPRPTREAR